MKAERWQEIEQLYHTDLKREATERALKEPFDFIKVGCVSVFRVTHLLESVETR